MPLTVSFHAVERYIDRCRPYLGFVKAKEDLMGLAKTAKPIKWQSIRKERYFLAEDQITVFLVHPNNNVILTVLHMVDLEEGLTKRLIKQWIR